MKTIRVVSTTGDKLKTIQSQSTNWKDLKKELEGMGYGLKESKVMVGETKKTLQEGVVQNVENQDLPETDFSVFILPTKTKSGQ